MEKELDHPKKSDWWKPMWQEDLLEETVGDTVWEDDIPVCHSEATVEITLCPQTLSLSRALLLGSAGEEGQNELSLAASSHPEEFGSHPRRAELCPGHITLWC